MGDSKAKGLSSVGGLPFFISFFFLTFLSILNFDVMPLLWDQNSRARLINFALGLLPGVFIAMYVLQGHSSVLVHEFKHSLISGLAGNKSRGLKVQKDSGHFEYEYTRLTAQYNAFIALAPYLVPLFTLPAFALAYAFWRHSHELMVVVVGIGYGLDLVMNVRDISPRQSDIYSIKGGYLVGLGYIMAMNAAIFSFLLAWILRGGSGIKALLFGLWQFMQFVALHFTSIAA